MEYEKDIKQFEANVANMTQDERIGQAKLLNDKLTGEVQSAKAKGQVDEQTVGKLIENANLVNKQLIEQTKATTAGTKATEAGTTKTEQETKNLQQQEVINELNTQLKKKA